MCVHGALMHKTGDDSTPGQAAKLLKEIRESLGGAVTMRELAEALGKTHASHYQQYESRYKRPFLPIETLQPIARTFAKHGVSPETMAPLWGVPTQAVAEAIPEYAFSSEEGPAPRDLDEGAVMEAYVATRRGVRGGIIDATTDEDEARIFLRYYRQALLDRSFRG
jgi:transcriptional regulator with XRE-family HTH domain